ncbi:GH18 domain-containing protein [Caenorhabditis elegans]|uniref:GH18 domain-containing protein n=1 Tax=Caenorhabditis elegans TaxID=6239 RepID=G5EBF8_CAEEL|nr:GH18 domain-containing protein [Caenorhabditis elegans]CAA93874.1 GH18 domain-containing protein [Caenorhabditis elegans]|eukprot:NP_001254212.1 CHItinase-Like [Caenorhabditis elegans]
MTNIKSEQKESEELVLPNDRPQYEQRVTKQPTSGKYIIITITLISIIIVGFGLGLCAQIYFQAESDVLPICDKRIIGYYSGSGTSNITSTQLSNLTHTVFAFVYMTPDGTLLFNNQIEKNRFLKLKEVVRNGNSKIKLMFSIGGKDNSKYFSSVIPSEERIQTFIESILEFLEAYDLDGVDLFWKWPEEEYRDAYFAFINQLRKTFEAKKKYYILSIVIPPPTLDGWGKKRLNKIIESVDFINAYSTDYYTPLADNLSDDIAGPSAPIYFGAQGKSERNVHHTARNYSCLTKQASKFNIVIPFYATLWENVYETVLDSKRGVYRHVAPFYGRTVGKTYLSRLAVKQEGFQVESYSYDPAPRAAFSYNRTIGIYLTFETKESIRAKIDYVKDRILGGVWIFSVDMDDETNSQLKAVSFDGFCTIGNGSKYECV